MPVMEKNNVWKSGCQVWLRLIFASVICFIVWFSIDALCLSFMGEESGYQIYAYDENGENPQLIISHTYAEGEDKTAEIKLEDNQVITRIRSMSPVNKAIAGIISSVFTWLIFGIFPYSMMWAKGSHDENYVFIGRLEEDVLFGLKVGVIATIPSAILYLMLILGKFGVFPPTVLVWHRLINSPFIPYLDAVEMGAKSATELSVGSLLSAGAILLFVPLVSGLAYYLGYRGISIRERLIYKKNEAE